MSTHPDRVFWIVCLAAVPVLTAADPPAEVTARLPAMTSVFPSAARPGGQIAINIRGEFLDGVKRIEFESPGITGAIVSAAYTNVQAKVTVAANAEPGSRYFRIFSDRGATNLLAFRITRWRDAAETPGTGELSTATRVPVPSIVSGVLNADMSGMEAWGEEADLYRFHARKGQRLQLNLFGTRILGTRAGLPQLNADLSLTLLRADGHQLTFNEGRFLWDPFIDHTFEEDGDYIAAVTVTRAPTTVVLVYPKFEPAVYHLAIGNTPVLWTAYPAGARRGQEVEVELRADSLPAKPVLTLNSHGLSGEIRADRQPGVFRLKLRSSADASLGLHHISIRDDSGTAAPLRFALGDLPERMEAEPNDSRENAETLVWPATVNGRMGQRGDADWYRIEVTPGKKLVLDVQAESLGGSMLDTVLTLTDSKGKVLKTADDGAVVSLAASRDPLLVYTFTDGGTYYVKLTGMYREFGPDQIYRFSVREPSPDFRIALPSRFLARGDPKDRFSVPQAGKISIPLALTRLDDFEGGVTVEVRGLPQGATAKPLAIAAKQVAGKLEITAPADAPLGISAVEIVASAAIGGGVVRRTVLLPAVIRDSGPGFWDYRSDKLWVAVAPPTHFSLEPLAEVVYLVRGQSADFPVKLTRRAGFTAPLKFSVHNLPPGVELQETEEMDQGRQLRVRLKASATAAKVKLSDMIVAAEAVADGRAWIESSPKVTLQLE